VMQLVPNNRMSVNVSASAPQKVSGGKFLALAGCFFLHCGFSGLAEFWPLFIFLGFIYFLVSFFFVPVGLAIIALAMIFSPEIPIGAIESRALNIRIEDLLIPVIVLSWIAQNAVMRKDKLIVSSPLNKPIALLLLVMLVSTAIGFAQGHVTLLPALFFSAKIIEYFVLFFLTMSYVKSEKQVRIFLVFALITVACLVCYTLPQVPSSQALSANRITAPFEDIPQPTTAGGYLAFSFFIVFSLMIYQKSFIKKFVLGFFCLLIFLPMLYSFSRTVYMMMAAGLVILAILSKLKWLRLLVLAAFLAAPIIAPGKVKERVAFTWTDAVNPNRELGVDVSFQERIYSFRRAGNALKINPILGLGMASWDYPDNQYARTLHEIGILGMGLWLWIFFRLYKLSRWVFDVSEGTFKGLALGYAAGVFGILIHGFGACTFYIVRIMEPFWFISGLVVSLYQMKVLEFQARAESHAADPAQSPS